MKTLRYLAAATLLLSVSVSGFGQKVFDDIPGSYAIYHDTRFETETYVGVAYAGDDTLLLRSYEPKSGNELVLLVPIVSKKDDPFDIGGDLHILKGQLKSSTAADRLLPMVLNWGTTWIKHRKQINENLHAEAETDDHYFYEYWIPVFQLRKIADPQNRFTLVTAGILQGRDDPNFFMFQGMPAAKKSQSFHITPGKPIDSIIDGLKVPLDANWKTEDKRIYRIQEKTNQDAAFLIETMDLKKQGIASPQELLKLMILGNRGVTLLADGTRVFKANGSYNLFMRVFDPKTDAVSIQESQVVGRGKDVVSIATLASFETLYNDNKEYFDHILY